MNAPDKHKEELRAIVTDQLEIIETYLTDKKLFVQEAQARSLFRPCKLGKLEGCAVCKAKRWILRKRYT